MPSESIKTLLKRVFQQLNIFNHAKIWRMRRRNDSSSTSENFSWSTTSSPSFATMGASSQLKQVFKFFDTNGDGKISPLELSEVLHSLGHEKTLASKEAEGIIKQVDFNGDGFIDLDEFMIVMDSTHDDKEEEGGKKKQEEEEDLKNAFVIFDTDKNGFICAKDLQRVLMSLGCRNCSIKECRKMIKGVDRDGDGFVDFQEFKSMMISAGNSAF